MEAPARLTDRFGRRIEYLRISVTERCDLRCAYCHPGRQCEAAADVLSPRDIEAIGLAATALGIHAIRLTGGEPLLREDLEEIVSRLAVLPGLTDLALTTNGQTLATRAAALAAAGLRRVNVSLDSLNPKTYAAVTGGGEVAAVLRGLEAALAAGLDPVKVNVVLTSPTSLAREDLLAFVELIRRRPLHVRFIEAMPTCSHAAYLPAERLLERFGEIASLLPVPGPEGSGPARYYQVDDSEGSIGLITPISDPFCARCNRLRVTARGDLIPCLFSPSGVSLLAALRSRDPVSELAGLIEEAVSSKPLRYGEVSGPAGISAMHIIGG